MQHGDFDGRRCARRRDRRDREPRGHDDPRASATEKPWEADREIDVVQSGHLAPPFETFVGAYANGRFLFCCGTPIAGYDVGAVRVTQFNRQ
jgi:hypothetical protein